MLWWTLRQLKSSNPETRAAAARELALAGEMKAVPSLIEALADETLSVRIEAAKALGALPHPAAVEPLAKALAEAAGKARVRRPGTGKPSESGACEALATALGQQGKRASRTLIGLLASEDREARRWAAQALGLVKDPQAIAPLADCLGDGRSEVRKAAAHALGTIGDAGALVHLDRALANRDPETRKTIVEALGAIGGENAANAIARGVEDENESVQLAAVEALRKTGGLNAGFALRRALETGRRKSVTEAAAAALKEMKFTPATAEERAAVAVLLGDFAAAAREGNAAVDVLNATLESRDSGRRGQAVAALGSIGAAISARPLARVLRDHDPKVRAAAAEALAAIGLPAVEVLKECLESPDAAVDALAARALGRIGDPRAAGALAGAVARNRSTQDSYPEPMEAVKAASEALAAILTRAASEVSREDLERIAAAPDGLLEHPGAEGEDAHRTERVVDCGPIRDMAARELERRARE